MARGNIADIVAEAIRGADRSWFNEDYGKQATAVLTALRKAGYEIVPREPSDALVAFVDENMPIGRLRPTDLLRQLYRLMVENSRRLG